MLIPNIPIVYFHHQGLSQPQLGRYSFLKFCEAYERYPQLKKASRVI